MHLFIYLHWEDVPGIRQSRGVFPFLVLRRWEVIRFAPGLALSGGLLSVPLLFLRRWGVLCLSRFCSYAVGKSSVCPASVLTPLGSLLFVPLPVCWEVLCFVQFPCIPAPGFFRKFPVLRPAGNCHEIVALFSRIFWYNNVTDFDRKDLESCDELSVSCYCWLCCWP